MPEEEKRIVRNYEIDKDLHDWLKEKAQSECRPIIKQLEVIIEQARKIDK